jgi:hypothetical protein
MRCQIAKRAPCRIEDGAGVALYERTAARARAPRSRRATSTSNGRGASRQARGWQRAPRRGQPTTSMIST